jgi:pyridoxamine 5'-phosphate oxidase
LSLAPFSEPFERFASLLATAEGLERSILPEPTAFALATVGEGGRPAVRMLLIKGVDERGFTFFTNYEGRKGRELLSHPSAAMCFHWQPLEVQVRVEGEVSVLGAEESDAYFATRPRGSQLGAWASEQSRELPDSNAFERRLAEFEQRFAGTDVPRPPHWGGFRLNPDRIEFWRNRPNRWHERELYQREAGGWRVSRLYP